MQSAVVERDHQSLEEILKKGMDVPYEKQTITLNRKVAGKSTKQERKERKLGKLGKPGTLDQPEEGGPAAVEEAP